jgi:hypothetical protein
MMSFLRFQISSRATGLARNTGAALALASLFVQAAAGQVPGAANVVVPNYNTTNEGSTAVTYPFSQNSMRYQQVYLAAQFPVAGPISEIAFRPDGPLGTGAGTLSPLLPTGLTVKVMLSTTSMAPGGLSTTFTDNLGSDNTVVYDSSVNGPWQFSTSFAGPGGTQPSDYNAFDIRMRLPGTFYYDPAKGNLLLDVTITASASGLPALDAEATQSGTVSRLYATSATATVATGSDSTGLATQFTFGSFAVTPAVNCGASHHQLAWIVFTKKLDGIRALNSSLAAAAFNNACTLIAGSPTARPVPPGWSSVPLASLDSFTNFRSDLLTPGGFACGYQVVLYDNETWGGQNLTPLYEQQNPAAYEALFANLAHAYGYAFLAGPATDLVKAQLAYDPGQKIYPQYISMGFPRFSTQAPAEVYDIQAQGSQATEPSPTCSSTYCSFVQSAAQAANQANPATVVYAGVSTDPVSVQATVSQMYGAVNDTNAFVTGYWLNVPDSNYALAVSFLQAVQSAGWIPSSN